VRREPRERPGRVAPGSGGAGLASAAPGCSVVGVEAHELQQAWLDRALDSAGVDRGSWRPGRGVEENRRTIEAVYGYYGRLFLDRPYLQWAGLAGMIGPASGMFDGIASGISASWWDNPPLWAVNLVVTLSVLVPEIALIASVVAATAAVRADQTPGETQQLIKGILSRRSIRRLTGLADREPSTARSGVDGTAASLDPSSTSEK
jgi:hypothetical protein